MSFSPEEAELDQARHLLTEALIRLPHHPRREESELWRVASYLLPQTEAWPEDSPVTGVATTTVDGPAVVVLLRREPEIDMELDTEALRSALGVTSEVRTLVCGRIVPAARPAQGGDSLSGDGIGGDTGTLGCLVQTATNDLLVLGCNHTLAGVNQAVVNQDTVCQPGVADGGIAPGDTLGKLVNYNTILLGGHHTNAMDAAVAEPDNPADVLPGVRGIGPIAGVGLPLRYEDRVHKVGWGSGYTAGTYIYKLSYQTQFPGIGPAVFLDQYGIVGDDLTGFAQQGDSGSAVLTEHANELVGMVIGVAHGMNMAIASPIDPVLSTFGVTPAP